MTLITSLKGIGEKTAKLYEKLGITTVEDAVFYFPRDYITYSPIVSPDMTATETVSAIEATVVKRPLMKRVRKLSITSVTLSAEGMHITATFFNMPYLSKSLMPGRSYVFYGKIIPEGDHYHMEQPRIFSREDYEELLGHINPVYSLTKGLTNSAVTKTIKRSFDLAGDVELVLHTLIGSGNGVDLLHVAHGANDQQHHHRQTKEEQENKDVGCPRVGGLALKVVVLHQAAALQHDGRHYDDNQA